MDAVKRAAGVAGEGIHMCTYKHKHTNTHARVEESSGRQRKETEQQKKELKKKKLRSGTDAWCPPQHTCGESGFEKNKMKISPTFCTTGWHARLQCPK